VDPDWLVRFPLTFSSSLSFLNSLTLVLICIKAVIFSSSVVYDVCDALDALDVLDADLPTGTGCVVGTFSLQAWHWVSSKNAMLKVLLLSLHVQMGVGLGLAGIAGVRPGSA
jgi:hypothetical protein